MAVRVIKKSLAGSEDLLLGFGTELQVRNDKNIEITKINAGNIPYDENKSISDSITKKVDTLANMRAMNELPETVWCSGYHSKNDGAFGSHFYRLKGLKTTETDNGGTVIVVSVGGSDYVYELQYSGAVNVKWFGARGDGVTDDTGAIQNTVNLGHTVHIPKGVYRITSPITFSVSIVGEGRDEGQTELVLSGTATLKTTDWYASLSNLMLRSSVTSLVFITINGMSHGRYKDIRFKKEGSATTQVGILFDTTIASIYFNEVNGCIFNGLYYPIRITGNTSQVFNGNKIGTVATNYYQSFATAITIEDNLACDANEFGGYFETGTNCFSIQIANFRQNRVSLIRDVVTNVLTTGVAITGSNIWKLLSSGGFIVSGTHPQNQILIGTPHTKIRATQSGDSAIPNAAPIVLTYNVKNFDTLNEFSNGAGRFQPINAGYYKISASALSSAVSWSVTSRWEIRVYKNGVEYAKGDWNASEATATINKSSSVSTTVYMNGTTDYLEVKIIHNQGSTVNLDSSPSGNYIDINRITP